MFETLDFLFGSSLGGVEGRCVIVCMQDGRTSVRKYNDSLDLVQEVRRDCVGDCDVFSSRCV